MNSFTRAIAAAILLTSTAVAQATVTAISTIEWSNMTVSADAGLQVVFDPYDYSTGYVPWPWDGESVSIGAEGAENAPGRYGYAYGVFHVVGTGTATVTIPFSLSAITTAPYEAPVWRSEYAGASAGGALYFDDTTVWSDVQSITATNRDGTPSATGSGLFTFQLTGLGAESIYTLTGQHYAYATVTRAQPIPEPETYAMMLAGVGALAAARRRRSA